MVATRTTGEFERAARAVLTMADRDAATDATALLIMVIALAIDELREAQDKPVGS